MVRPTRKCLYLSAASPALRYGHGFLTYVISLSSPVRPRLCTGRGLAGGTSGRSLLMRLPTIASTARRCWGPPARSRSSTTSACISPLDRTSLMMRLPVAFPASLVPKTSATAARCAGGSRLILSIQSACPTLVTQGVAVV